MERLAECSCRAVRLKTTSEPDLVVACNCLECQRRTGSVFGVSSYFNRSSVQVLQGETISYIQGGDSGRKNERHFCKSCGTTVYWYSEVFPEKTGIAVGCFEDPNFKQPSHAVWTESKHHWVDFPDTCTLLKEQTPG